MAHVWQKPIPEIYRTLSDEKLRERVAAARAKLGKRLVILGHHYQQDDVVAFADYSGDSFQLARIAAEQKEAEYVIFCGVHFMAESADVLTDPSVHVILPDLGAGCSMADMANLDQTYECWEQLEQACPGQRIVPVTYMNSSAAIKAFVGEHGGAVCTSSNANKVVSWALGGTEATKEAVASKGEPKTKILFFPDQHLGRNTAHALGFSLDRMIVWNPYRDMGGNTPEAVRNADFILWKGHCSVHQLFRPEHVDQVRQKYPGVKVICHPECAFEVVQKADLAGSTAYITKTIQSAPAGTTWAIGTEVHLITRLKNRHPDKTIMILSDCQCMCTTMYRIDLAHLCWAMENLAEGQVVNEIKVDDQTRQWATVALQRMLDINSATTPPATQPAPTSV